MSGKSKKTILLESAMLADHGADVDVKDDKGKTPLHCAAVELIWKACMYCWRMARM